MKRIKWLIFKLCFILLLPTLVQAEEFDQTEQIAFGLIVLAQTFDGLTTAASLRDMDTTITEDWAWKYGTNRPSPSRLWVTKGVELILIYGFSKMLPRELRKPFMFMTVGFLTSCAVNNGIAFSITY